MTGNIVNTFLFGSFPMLLVYFVVVAFLVFVIKKFRGK